jgi:hypothetical protein
MRWAVCVEHMSEAGWSLLPVAFHACWTFACRAPADSLHAKSIWLHERLFPARSPAADMLPVLLFVPGAKPCGVGVSMMSLAWLPLLMFVRLSRAFCALGARSTTNTTTTQLARDAVVGTLQTLMQVSSMLASGSRCMVCITQQQLCESNSRPGDFSCWLDLCLVAVA